MTTRKFGALRDVHDVRDRMYRASPRTEPVPQHVDLREWGGPVKDQGDEGSCTGHAFSSAREWIARKYEKTSPILSPQCLYVEELLADGSFPKDEGAMPRTGCQALTAKGCCEASLYPYVAGKFTAPTAEQAQNAQVQDWRLSPHRNFVGVSPVPGRPNAVAGSGWLHGL